MKPFFPYLPAFLFFFLLGCQENSITDPGTIDDNVLTAQDDQNTLSKDFISAYPRVIEITDLIYDPTHPLNIYGDQIKGIIRYNHEVSPTRNLNKYQIDLKFNVNLKLDANCPNHSDCMKILGSAAQRVEVSGSIIGNYVEIVKVFRVCNCCCGQMKLILKFNVDMHDVKLTSMRLKRIINRMPFGDPEL